MKIQPIGPAYRIRTERLLLRCWRPDDAPALCAAILESLDHLRRWMAWAEHEPESTRTKVQRLRQYRGQFDLDRQFIYGILDRKTEEVIGGCGLHPRIGDEAFEIGYWIHTERLHRGYATEAAGALTRVAFEVHRIGRVEIRCSPENHASAGVARRLGFTHEATLRRRGPLIRGIPSDSMIWTMHADEYASTAAAKTELEAFDVIDERVL